jgi:hypothetical protein
MSLNQVNFFVLPEYYLDNIIAHVDSELDGEVFFDDELIWNKYKKHYSMFNSINDILPLNISWSKNIILFGDETSNRLEVLFNENGTILSVSFRIDVTSNYEIILIRLLDFYKSNNLVVIDEELNLLELKLNSFEKIIRNSNRFNL